MKEKIYEPARHNETSPAEGMAAVNTHTPEEQLLSNTSEDQNHQAARRTADDDGTSTESKKDAE